MYAAIKLWCVVIILKGGEISGRMCIPSYFGEPISADLFACIYICLYKISCLTLHYRLRKHAYGVTDIFRKNDHFLFT